MSRNARISSTWTGRAYICLWFVQLMYLTLKNGLEASTISSALGYRAFKFDDFLQPLRLYADSIARDVIGDTSSTELSIYHNLPLMQIVYRVCEIVSRLIGEYSIYWVLVLLCGSIVVLCISLMHVGRIRIFMYSLICLVSYPFILALATGNIGSLIAGSSLCVAFLGVFRGWKKICYVGCFLALSIRPNYLPLVIGLYFSLYQRYPRRCLTSLLILLVTLVASSYMMIQLEQLSNQWYTLSSISNGLHLYQGEYVYGYTGMSFGSSLLGVMKGILYKLQDLLGVGLITKDSIRFMIIANLMIGIACCCKLIDLFVKGVIGKINLIVCMALLVIMITPVLADYHLFIFVFILGYDLFADSRLGNLDNSLRLSVLLISVPLQYQIHSEHPLMIGMVIRPILALVCLMVYLSRTSSDGLRLGKEW